MARPVIYYDSKSGVLRPNLVWEPLCEVDLITEGSGWVYGEASWLEEDSPRAEPDLKALRRCPVSSEHVFESSRTNLRVDLFGGAVLGDFIPIWDVPGWYVSAAFAQRLKHTGLTGGSIKWPVRVGVNQSRVANPSIWSLQFLGVAGFDLRWRIKHGVNACPHCGEAPVICPGCGATNHDCPSCGKPTLYLPHAPEVGSELGFATEGYPDWAPKAYVVEGKAWDGADFFTTGRRCFVSDRAKRWMERTHTFPIAFKPALLNVEGMDPALLKKLKEDR